MSFPKVVSRDEWLVARRKLLQREKEFTRARDTLAADRRRLPMVRIDKDYRFTGLEGEAGLLDLFGGHQQLIVQHLMFDPSWEHPCGSCTAMADGLSDGARAHLRKRDTAFAAVSRAPYPKLETVRRDREWTFPWYSSHGSDFNYDLHVTLDPTVQPAYYNYRDADELVAADMEWMVDYTGEQPGVSSFLRDGDEVFHTYSTYHRGVDVMMPAYLLLDITALGRQELWEEPKGRAPVIHQQEPVFAH